MDQETDQNPHGFGETVPITSNEETEPVPAEDNYQEQDNFWDNAIFNKEQQDGDDHVNENDNKTQLPSIPLFSKGQGLPYAPIDYPSAGDVWTWRVGRRVTATGAHKDRFLILPDRLRTKNAAKSFASKTTLSRYLETNFPDVDVNAFFASFTWNIPALIQLAEKVDAASLFEETSKDENNNAVDDGENKEGSSSRYSQRKRKPMQQTQTYEPVEEKPKPTQRGSYKRKKEKQVAAATTAATTKQRSSSKRSTRQQQGGVIDLEEEGGEENEPAAAKKTGKRMKRRRGNNVAAAQEEEDVSIPHIYVSPMNGVLAVSHSPVDVNPEEFDTYLNTLENLLQQQPQEAGQQASSSVHLNASSPMREYEWAEARMKLSSLLDKDFSSLFMSNEAAEMSSLATKLKKDPSLSAEEIVRLKLIEEIPTFSEVFQENKSVIVEADRFFSALELNKAKVASLKYEYSDLKEKLGNIQSEVDSNADTIRQIDEQIAQLQARRTELTRGISKKEKEKVDLSYGQKMVANSIPKVVQEVQAANSKKPEWEMKKENALKREAEILNKFSSLKAFYF
ncbi:unnamed protein product [Microthlaspi erraticum]|uniref:DUF7081 domain-containing protein n=1 Tax=Microthlaspi erraticum TaxID=1685480 RepID=A0A6D2JZF6_9BRAS|nr:unnamed protein product [Microthlaspi erraticum]CAA7045346.1 unnamed protein product [Microthlaspi erraticum]